MAKSVESHSEKKRVCVTGAGGFIAAHLSKRLREKHNCYVIAVDRKRQEFFKEEEFCDEFILADLRSFKNCLNVSKNCEEVYNLAADMGGMGFIQSNEAVLMWNNTMISSNMLEASRRNKVGRFFYSSSACCYNEKKQLVEDNPGLKEGDAWPAWPQDTYGLEKLYGEEMAMVYGKDFDIETRIARFHNIYGPHGTWRGGREKAPAAFCRKAAVAQRGQQVEIWGNGKQTRSFCYIDDCVEGILRIMQSDYKKPLNLGSDEMITINDLAKLALTYEGKDKSVSMKHIEGPEGVRGRNSDNTLIKQVLGWAPSIPIKDGLKMTYDWIKAQVQQAQQQGDSADFGKSVIVQQTEDMLDDFIFD